MKDTKFTMIDENGNEREYEVLFTFESEETNKNYIVYTDNTTDATGNDAAGDAEYWYGANTEDAATCYGEYAKDDGRYVWQQ